MKGLVIWAHSKCRSTFDLYREVIRQSPVPVRLVFWKGILDQRIQQGFSGKVFDEIPSVTIGENWEAAEKILSETVGWTHLVTAYQVSRVYQRVMAISKARGDRVVVYSEAPCEMCLGVRAVLKRLYYRLVLPWKIRPVVRNADMILSQSGTMGVDRLVRLGWKREQIVPFGYASGPLQWGSDIPVASDREGVSTVHATEMSRPICVLHLGSEAAYRGVRVLEKAVALLKKRGVQIELIKTGGMMSLDELVAAIRAADVVVGCGLCEPWGMRINDAVLEGKPVVVSDGMGVAYMVEQEGCGLVVPKNDPKALATALERCAQDHDYLHRLTLCAQQAVKNWSPAARARLFLDHVLNPIFSHF